MTDLTPTIARAAQGDDLSIQWQTAPNFAAGNAPILPASSRSGR